MTPFDRSHMISHSRSIVTLVLACTVSEIYRDTAASYKDLHQRSAVYLRSVRLLSAA